MDGERSTQVGDEKFTQKLAGKPEGKIPLRRHTCKCKDIIQMEIR
jgi:hypothetical protein